jgi:hypothetical protein
MIVIACLSGWACHGQVKRPVRIQIPETRGAPPSPAGNTFLMPDPPPTCDDRDDDRWCDDDECDDNNATVHPGAPEVAGDHVDQDCDGYD